MIAFREILICVANSKDLLRLLASRNTGKTQVIFVFASKMKVQASLFKDALNSSNFEGLYRLMFCLLLCADLVRH